MVQEPPEERLLLTSVPSPVVGVDLVGVVVVLLVLAYSTSSAEVVTACVVALAIGEEVEAVVCWVEIVSIAVDGAAVDGAAVDGSAVDGSAVDGAAVNGSAVDGAAVDGAAVDGAAVDGAAVDGVVIAGGSERTISYHAVL